MAALRLGCACNNQIRMHTTHHPDLVTPSALGLLQSEMPADRWMCDTPCLNLDDEKVQLRAQTLTQFVDSTRAKVLAIFAFVQSLHYFPPGYHGVMTARQVLDRRGGHAYGKSTLFVALLRASDIPARMRFVQVQGKVLRGLAPVAPAVDHAIVEVWLRGRWVRTDLHVYDGAYLLGATYKLREAGWRSGYGLHVKGAKSWNGISDAFISFAPDQQGGTPLEDWGVYNDPDEFRRQQFKENFAYDAIQGVRRLFYAPAMHRSIQKTRELGRELREQRRALKRHSSTDTV